MEATGLRNASELARRLDLVDPEELLLVDSPDAFERLLAEQRPPPRGLEAVESRAIRSVKRRFPAILVWREDRVGSRALFESLVKRLEPHGTLWVVTAMKKVTGVKTPASRRLELPDLRKAFAPERLVCDREFRISAWHVAYRFVESAG